MSEAAHPQQEPDTVAAASGAEPAAKNPFPSTMTVPGEDGEMVTIELAVVDGVVYAPPLDQLPLSAQVRQYVTQYCAAWSSSVLTTDRVAEGRRLTPPRRAQLVFDEGQLHAMLGLAADENVVAVIADQLGGTVRFVVDSPRLAPKEFWGVEPPVISLPIAAWYEGREAAR